MSKKIITIIIAFIFTMISMVMAFQWEDESGNIHHKGKHKFDKPIIEKDSKLGPWKDSPNIGSVDPKNYFCFEDDFLYDSTGQIADADVWLTTMGATIQDDAMGGQIWLGAISSSVDNMQVNGESFKLESGKPIWFETKFKLTDIDKDKWFVGFSVADTAIIASLVDGIGFGSLDNTGDIDLIIRKNSMGPTIDTGYNLTDATAVRLGFMWDGSNSKISTYINDVIYDYTVTGDYIPNDEALTPSVEVNIGAIANVIKLDYIKVIQER